MSDGGAGSAMTWLREDLRRFDLTVAVLVTGIGTLLVLGNPDEFDTGWPEAAAGVGAFGLVLFRRRAPEVLLGVGLVALAAHFVIYSRPTPMFFAVLVLIATVCVRLDRRRAIILGGSIGFGTYLLSLGLTDVRPVEARALISLVWTAAAVGTADAVRSWRRYRESSEAQIRSAVLAAEAQTRQEVSEERLTIARELHDLLAHNLSVMNVQTGAALHLLRSDPDRAEQSLTAARDAGKGVLEELRELLAVLRHEGDEPTSSLPTVEELDTLVETMRSAGLDVTWSRSGAPRPVTPAVSLAAYRITQEALTNAAKHGDGRADLVTEWDDTGLKLLIANQATVANGDGGGHGLVGMRERATLNGGHVRAEPIDGRFEVEAWLPIADQEPSA
ncbi:MAG: histidine kinase [Actinomycetota bacterium]